MNIDKKIRFLEEAVSIVGKKNVIKTSWKMYPYSKGWRYGEGKAIAVIKPGRLVEIWEILKLCVKEDVVIIMQAANTGLTGGSTPFGNDYDRSVVIINTLRVNNIQMINKGDQIIGFAGSSLHDLEKKLKPLNREPHSIIGSTSIGASIIGGICNNSGGSLVKRGPAFTELALYARINSVGKLELVNELDIYLGSDPEEILNNLENKRYSESDILNSKKLGSDDKYPDIVKSINSDTPSRFNSDPRLLNDVSGNAGKTAVFAVRVDTYPAARSKQVYYLGTNDVNVFWKMRREILSNFKNLPDLGDYLHRDCYDAAKKYSKDTFLVIERLGTKFLPTLFELKRIVDIIAGKFRFFPENFSDRLMQFLSYLWPNHLPRKMDEYRNLYEHHWIIEMSDDGINEADQYFKDFFKNNDGSFFKCNSKESKKAMMQRYVAASAVGRYHTLNKMNVGEMLSMDIALPRNEKNWFEKLPQEIDDLFEMKLYYGHLFCHVLHQNYIVKKGVDVEKLKEKLLKNYEQRGAEFPAEHNFGHEYKASADLVNFYKNLDPTNSFNPGIGGTSKLKNWK